MRKPNVQSPLDRLSDERQHALWELLQGASYEEALPKVREAFGVETTASSLSRFVKRRGVVERLRENVYVSEAFAREADVKTLDRRTRAAVVSAMWEALNTRKTEDVVALGRLLASLDIDSRRAEQLALAREKFEAAERRAEVARETMADDRLTPEERLQELDRLFGK